MHDSGYIGEMGTFGEGENTRIWIFVPQGQTISPCPQYLPAGQAYATPGWLSAALAFRAGHPDVAIVSDEVQPLKLAAGEWVPVLHFFQASPPPRNCDPATFNSGPNAVEYRILFSGDLSAVSFPEEVQHYLYRVPYPLVWHTLWTN